MSTKYSVGQMNQLGDALELAGFTPEDVTQLRNYSRLGDIKNVVNGLVDITRQQHIIDCDVEPYCPDGWRILSSREQLPSRVRGEFVLDRKIGLYIPEEQKKVVAGNRVRELLQDQPVLPANVLDYLLANPHLIPEEWKGEFIFFWGTIYRDPSGRLVVRCLYWNGDRWDWDCYRFDSAFPTLGSAALAAST
jgi:hypothetical protein